MCNNTFPVVSETVLFLRPARSDAKAAIQAHSAEMETTPFRHFLTPKPCSSPGWGPGSAQATSLQSTDTEILSTYNAAMDKIASNITCTRLPLTSQLDSWDECTAEFPGRVFPWRGM